MPDVLVIFIWGKSTSFSYIKAHPRTLFISAPDSFFSVHLSDLTMLSSVLAVIILAVGHCAAKCCSDACNIANIIAGQGACTPNCGDKISFCQPGVEVCLNDDFGGCIQAATSTNTIIEFNDYTIYTSYVSTIHSTVTTITSTTTATQTSVTYLTVAGYATNVSSPLSDSRSSCTV